MLRNIFSSTIRRNVDIEVLNKLFNQQTTTISLVAFKVFYTQMHTYIQCNKYTITPDQATNIFLHTFIKFLNIQKGGGALQTI